MIDTQKVPDEKNPDQRDARRFFVIDARLRNRANANGGAG